MLGEASLGDGTLRQTQADRVNVRSSAFAPVMDYRATDAIDATISATRHQLLRLAVCYAPATLR